MITSIRLNKYYYISREAYSRDEMYIGHRRLCVCPSLAAFPYYCTDPNVRWRNGRGYPLVAHYWAGLQSVHGFRCYDKLECGPMPNLMVALLNIGGALCSTPQSLADAHY